MAKVTAPLFSHTARGALAKSVVYFPWKGIDVVRKYVVPTNPKTTGQITQRAKVTAAVAKWHLTSWNVLDRAAWTRLAGVSPSIMTGFNRFCKSWIDQLVAAKVPVALWKYVLGAVTAVQIIFTIDRESLITAADVWYGTTKTAMIYSVAGVLVTDQFTFTVPGLVANTEYFLQVRATAPVAQSQVITGIFRVKTIP